LQRRKISGPALDAAALRQSSPNAAAAGVISDRTTDRLGASRLSGNAGPAALGMHAASYTAGATGKEFADAGDARGAWYAGRCAATLAFAAETEETRAALQQPRGLDGSARSF
jgi:hypothetical protein